MLPLVSICIPNYNKASFIGETIDSVYNQTYPNIELIIVDDGSTDNSVEIIRNKIIGAPLRATFLQNTRNSGICFSLNKAISIAAGKYYQMIGSDDIILKNKIEDQVNVFEKLSEDYAIVFGKSYRMDLSGKYLEKDYYESIEFDFSKLETAGFEDLLSTNFISSASHLARLSSIREVGMYDESLHTEDWDLWLRLTKRFKFFFINEYDSVYRIVPTSLSNNSKNFAAVYYSYGKTLLKHINYSSQGNRNIAKNIESLSLIVYKYNGDNARKLLKRNFQLNKTLKSFILFISSRLGIKYKYYQALKSRNE